MPATCHPIKAVVAILALLALPIHAQKPPDDLDGLAHHITAGAYTTTDKVQAVVSWTNVNFEWTTTDYKNRTAEEIIARKGGNCNEQTMIVRSLLDRLGITTRRVREINIQPESASRQARAAEKVKESGTRYSVFGLRHNDHVWIEYYDQQTKEWYPADPTLDVVGIDAWIRARVGFGQRPTNAILPSRDMLVPIAVFAFNGEALEDRTAHYLVDAFDRAYSGRLSKLAAWSDWTRLLAEIDPVAKGAFQGRASLHESENTIAELEKAYEALRQAARQ